MSRGRYACRACGTEPARDTKTTRRLNDLAMIATITYVDNEQIPAARVLAGARAGPASWLPPSGLQPVHVEFVELSPRGRP